MGILSILGMIGSLVYLVVTHVALHKKMDAMNAVLSDMNQDIQKLAASKVVGRVYNGKG